MNEHEDRIIDKIVQGYFNVCLTTILEEFGKVHLIVVASEKFLSRYPFMIGHVKSINGLDVVILDISPNAVNHFTQTRTEIAFEMTIKGDQHFITVSYAEMVGIGEPGNPHPYVFSTIILSAIGEGFILKHPEQITITDEPKSPVKSSPPKLSIVR